MPVPGAGTMTRVLAIATNPITGASTRFRVLQWKSHLERAGFALAMDTFFSVRGAEILYRPGQSLLKLAHVVAGSARRVASLARAGRTADLILVHREAFPLGQRIGLAAIKRFAGPVVYDYDDAMFVPQRRGRGLLAWAENPGAPAEVMGISSMVLAGNEYLAAYARRFARRVIAFPTCIDTDYFRPTQRPTGAMCRVGWIGSHTTAKYLESLRPVLERVAADHRFELTVVGSQRPIHVEGAQVRHSAWALEHEVRQFQACDIGIYPLWEDPWTRGKCGFKAIQFMACGVPVVAAAIGVNREIIEDGVNGFLASTEAEWEEKLGLLLTDPGLGRKLGAAGRQTVEERYSLRAQGPVLVESLRSVLG
jgi:glycosyltransferase involved in cell wall biosynthesis